VIIWSLTIAQACNNKLITTERGALCINPLKSSGYFTYHLV
jgi:hypothetical protein